MPNWKKIIVSGSDASLNSLYVSSSFTASGLIYPTADNGELSFMQTDGSGNLSLQYVKTMYEQIVNGEATQITKGTPLYISGSQGASSIAYRADAGNPTKMPVTYIAADNIASGATGRGIILGLITDVDTTGYTPGTEVFVAVGGGWTATRPTGSAIVQSLGVITKEGNGGQGVVLNPGPNNIPNLNSGSVWVGNSSSVPIAVATSSLSVASAISASYSSVTTSASYSENSTSASYAISSSQAQNANTASYVLNAVSASYSNNSTSASYALSSSFASTASFVQTAQTASYVLNAVSSSYATQALSASFAVSSSIAISASFATSASWVPSSPAFPFTGSAIITGNLIITGSMTSSLDVNINGLTLGRGGGNVARNIAIGFQAGNSTNTNNITTPNIFMGYQAGQSNTSGYSHIFIGTQAGRAQTSGDDQIAIGYRALYKATNQYYNIAIGTEAGLNLTGSVSNMINNVLVGHLAGRNIGNGGRNSVFGSTAMGGNSSTISGSSNWNTAMGVGAGYVITSGSYNTAIGSLSLFSNVGANYNTAIGYNAANKLTTAGSCVYIGGFDGTGFETTSNNVFISDGDGNVRIRIGSTGNVIVGSTTDAGTGKLQVTGNIVVAGTTNNTYRWDATSGTPTNTATPAGWVKINIAGADAWLPYYQ